MVLPMVRLYKLTNLNTIRCMTQCNNQGNEDLERLHEIPKFRNLDRVFSMFG